MSTGTVKFFNPTKWFGFIKDDWWDDIFVHVTQIEWGELNEGDRVSYTPGQWQKWPQAENVQIIKQ